LPSFAAPTSVQVVGRIAVEHRSVGRSVGVKWREMDSN